MNGSNGTSSTLENLVNGQIGAFAVNGASARRDVYDSNERIKTNILQAVFGTELTPKHLLKVARQINTASELKRVAISLNIEDPFGVCETAMHDNIHDMTGAALSVLQKWRDSIAHHDLAWKILITALHEEMPAKLDQIFSHPDVS